jgi:Tol biopolymer transport system component/DNA-binding winged helix-turn-helix (wHTH) protein
VSMPTDGDRIFTFDDIEVREREFSIVKDGHVLAVEPKAFRVLLVLLQNPHRLITKDELLNAVWNDCAVSDNSLARSIALLRRLLGDNTRLPRYIATVPTVGYRFLLDVQLTDVQMETESVSLAASDSNEAGDAAVVRSAANTAVVRPSDSHPAPATNEALPAADLQERPEVPVLHRKRPAGKARHYVPIAVVCVCLAVALLWRVASPRSTATSPPRRSVASTARRDLRIVPLTNLPGTVDDPSFSPDGEKITFVWSGETPGHNDVYVQLVGSGSPLRLTHSRSGLVCCTDWSRDGRSILFGRCDDQGGGVYSVPALGGPERKLTTVACIYGDAGYPRWIGDGKALLMVDACSPHGPRAIIVFSLETGERRCLTSPLSDEHGDSYPILSPDQKTVAFFRGPTVGTPDLFTVPLSGGEARRLTTGGTAGWAPMWSSDGQHILFNSTRSGLSRVWQVAALGGPLSTETAYPGAGTLSADGRRLAYVDPPRILGRSLVISRLLLAAAGAKVLTQRTIHTADGGNNAPKLSPDGRFIAFESCRTGKCELWRSDADGENPLQLTFFDKGFPGSPAWSPDGRWIAFDQNSGRHSHVFLIDAEGRNLQVVTTGNYQNAVPAFSRDGSALYFASDRTREWQVWKRDLSTGREEQITRHGGFAATEAYDRRTIYYSRYDGAGIWQIPVGGGEERKVTSAPHRGYWGHFALTETGLYLVDTDALPGPTLMFFDFRTQRLRPILLLNSAPVPWGANLIASRDGRTIYLAHGLQHNSITMAENFMRENLE